jgi:heme/copper-type cytochrome/quinol oxidase subunit 4
MAKIYEKKLNVIIFWKGYYICRWTLDRYFIWKCFFVVVFVYIGITNFKVECFINKSRHIFILFLSYYFDFIINLLIFVYLLNAKKKNWNLFSLFLSVIIIDLSESFKIWL